MVLDPTTVEPMPDPDPIPLSDKSEIPPFPVDSLPKPIADMVNAVAEATQTDPAMAGTSGMCRCDARTRSQVGQRPAGLSR
jgi:replicative DNA helicase